MSKKSSQDFFDKLRDGTEAVPYEVALMRRGDFTAVIRPAKIQKPVCRRVRQTVFNYPR